MTAVDRDARGTASGLETLFGPAAEDADGDGYPDRLQVEIAVDPQVREAPIWAGILNLCARLAGEVLALDRPVVRLRSRMPDRPCIWVRAPSAGAGAEAELRGRAPGRAVLTGRSAAGMAALLDALTLGHLDRYAATARHVLRLEGGTIRVVDERGRAVDSGRLPGMTGRKPTPARSHEPDLLHPDGWMYRTEKNTPRERRLALAIEIDRQGLSAGVGLALSELAARAALGATALELPLAWAGPARAPGVRLRVQETSNRAARIACLADPDGSIRVDATGRGPELSRCLNEWMRVGLAGDGSAEEDGIARFRRRISDAADLLTGSGSWGGWSRRLLDAARAGGSLPPVAASARPRVVRACRRLKIPFPPVRAALPVLKLHERWAPEPRRILGALGQVPRGSGELRAIVLASRPEAQRRRLKSAVEQHLRAKGYRPVVTVLNAYKPGLSWLLEVVRPALQQREGVARCELTYRAFRAPGALEMESRFLQEAYPGLELLAEALGRPAETIAVKKRAALAAAYRFRAWDRRGRLQMEESFTPLWSELPYLPERPGLGRVHPSCSGFRLESRGRVVAEQALPTDREMFWRRFQERWLPAVAAAMRRRLAAGCEPPTVFWDDLQIEVAIDETDRRLGLGEERIAPLEALHEDLYFVLLDFFREFGREAGLGEGPQFGRIVPRVLARAPAAGPTATLVGRPRAEEEAATEPQAAVRTIGFAVRGRAIELEFSGGPALQAPGDADRLRAVARAWGLDLEPPGAAGAPARVRVPVPSASPPGPVVRGAKARPPLGRRIALREIEGWCRRLGALPGMRSRAAGRTWQGRRVWAVEAALPAAGAVSIARLRLLKPTLLVNARHHANEVSSTNAMLRLVWELGATPWGGRMLARVNVAVVPLENADGVATLEELLPEARDHKLHAARYNALGVEWYGDYFRSVPRFPEARVKPALWRRWLPLLVLDAHGVPSHEWDQPFSGGAPWRFRQYWIPRALIYAILPYVDRPGHPGHATARTLARTMAEALAADSGIAACSRELTGRYRRYARGPEPGAFPPAHGDSLLVVPPEPRLAGATFGVQRFPLTLSEIVTEVSDEVVSGPLLALCARAHLTVAKALLELLAQREPGRLARRPAAHGRLALVWQAGAGPAGIRD